MMTFNAESGDAKTGPIMVGKTPIDDNEALLGATATIDLRQPDVKPQNAEENPMNLEE